MVEAIGIAAGEIDVYPEFVALCVAENLEVDHVAPGWVLWSVPEANLEMVFSEPLDGRSRGTQRTVKLEILHGKLARRHG
jgi:hypothetical protein